MNFDIQPKKLPSGSWRAQIMIKGQRYSVTADSKAECKEQAVILQAKLDAGLIEHRNRLLESLTLRDIMTEYVDKRVNVLSDSTQKGYDCIINTRFKDYMDMPIADIKDWQEMVNEEALLVSATTVCKAWSFVKTCLKEYKIYPENVTLPQKVETETEFVQPEDLARFIEDIEGDPMEIGILLALHGLRRSEIYALTKNDVSDGMIRVRGATVVGRDGKFVDKKTNKNQTSRRDVPILIDRLAYLVEKSPKGKLVEPNHSALYRSVKRHCRNIGIPEVTLHGLRHTFASLCYHLKLSEMQTMKLGGWKDIYTMRKIYTHLADKDKEKAADTLKEFFKSCD